MSPITAFVNPCSNRPAVHNGLRFARRAAVNRSRLEWVGKPPDAASTGAPGTFRLPTDLFRYAETRACPGIDRRHRGRGECLVDTVKIVRGPALGDHRGSVDDGTVAAAGAIRPPAHRAQSDPGQRPVPGIGEGRETPGLGCRTVDPMEHRPMEHRRQRRDGRRSRRQFSQRDSPGLVVFRDVSPPPLRVRMCIGSPGSTKRCWSPTRSESPFPHRTADDAGA